MTHIADVQKVAICPVMYEAVCRCAQWKAVARTVDELREQFEKHKRADLNLSDDQGEGGAG